jgi:uncharacterized protein (TIGR02118 family)
VCYVERRVAEIGRRRKRMKLMLLFTRKAGVTPEAFRAYYETRHVPLSLRLLPYFKSYARNYVQREGYDPTGAGNAGPAFDVVTEITFETREDFEGMMRAMADPKILDQIVADEENFIDRSKLVMFFVDEAETPKAELKAFA